MRARAVARDGCGRRVRRAGPEPRGTPRRTKAPATRIWLGKLSNEPGHHPVAHHHGEAETAAYVLKGSARIYYGADYRDYVDLEEGDFLFVPPNFPHIESNRSETDELVWLTARSPDNIVVNLLTAGELAHLRQTRTEEAARRAPIRALASHRGPAGPRRFHRCRPMGRPRGHEGVVQRRAPLISYDPARWREGTWRLCWRAGGSPSGWYRSWPRDW
jgi:uncharacterized RmlC-like cupin family protein